MDPSVKRRHGSKGHFSKLSRFPWKCSLPKGDQEGEEMGQVSYSQLEDSDKAG